MQYYSPAIGTSVSIIIVSYNGMQYLPACLEALQAELRQQDEIILIDNASTDGSPDWVSQHFPTVRLHRNPSNQGFAAACNQAAQMTGGDVLVFLNQDTQVQPGWLRGLLEPLEQDPRAGLVTSQILLMRQSERINACGLQIHFSLVTSARGYLDLSDQHAQKEKIASVSGASFAIRRELWERLGGFDETLFMYSEEVDLSWRANQAGYASWYNPVSTVLHDQSERPTHQTLSYSTRNRLYLLCKNWKRRSLCLLLPGLLLAEIVEWLYLILEGQPAVTMKLAAYRWLIKNAGMIDHQRKLVRAGRTQPDWEFLSICSPGLAPRRITGGLPGKTLIAAVNLLFRANYWLALSIERALDW
jgi:GT2 family glycosyltransferase